MPFGSSYAKEMQSRNGSKGSKESAYMRWQGERIIRVIGAEKVYRSFYFPVNIGGRTVGRSIVMHNSFDNPMQKYMQSLGEDHPKFRKMSFRIITNVLDRTPVLRGSDDETIYPDEKGKFPVKGDPQLNNRVYLLEFGRNVMDQFQMLNERSRHPKTFQPITINDMDVIIRTSGTGTSQSRHVFPDNAPHAADLLPEDLINDTMIYDLDLAVRPMPYESQERLINGDDYGEVLKDLGWEPLRPSIHLSSVIDVGTTPTSKNEEKELF